MGRAALERYVSATDLATVTAGFLIRHREDVDASWRIQDSDGLWDIKGKIEMERKRWLILTAERTGPSGR